jgi:thymidylate synthase
MHAEYQYLNLLKDILDNGDSKTDRTNVGTKSVFGRSMRFNLSDGFPVFTTKRVFWKTAFKEMLWMLRGKSNIRELIEQNVHIWTDWPYKKYVQETGNKISIEEFSQNILESEEFAEEWGDLGPVYGVQWREWLNYTGNCIDQVQNVRDALKYDPHSRRIIIEGWNVAELDDMALPPCHKTYQFTVTSDKKLNGILYQRSGDAFLGVPFNVANLALMTSLFAHDCGYLPGEIIWYGADVHIYNNHIDAVKEQLKRDPFEFPTLSIDCYPKPIYEYTIDDLEILDYQYHPSIKADVAV